MAGAEKGYKAKKAPFDPAFQNWWKKYDPTYGAVRETFSPYGQSVVRPLFTFQAGHRFLHRLAGQAKFTIPVIVGFEMVTSYAAHADHEAARAHWS